MKRLRWEFLLEQKEEFLLFHFRLQRHTPAQHNHNTSQYVRDQQATCPERATGG